MGRASESEQGAAVQEVGGPWETWADGGNVSMSGNQCAAVEELRAWGRAAAASDRPQRLTQQMSGWLLVWCGGPLLIRMWFRDGCLVRKTVGGSAS